MSIKSNQAGRSMIEMLGVLAIVGVLSVGAIAEFGKAMYKWKAIKCTEEYNLFIQDLLVYKDDFVKMMRKAGGGYFYLADVLSASRIVPSGWQRGTGSYKDSFFDSMGNRTVTIIRSEKDQHARRLDVEFVISKDLGSEARDFCRRVFNDVLKQNSASIYVVLVAEKKGSSWGHTGAAAYGDGYCSGRRKCLSHLSFSDIEDTCNFCSDEQEACNILVMF